VKTRGQRLLGILTWLESASIDEGVRYLANKPNLRKTLRSVCSIGGQICSNHAEGDMPAPRKLSTLSRRERAMFVEWLTYVAAIHDLTKLVVPIRRTGYCTVPLSFSTRN
jgi:hypothetical protein